MKTKLDSSQRESLRRALEAKRAELRLDLARREEETREGCVDSPELEDVAEGVIEDRLRRSLDERDRTTLREIERALAKFDAGTYGLSEVTGRPIRPERLEALPWARFDTNEDQRLAS
jgi:DnaK suppressor protein